MASSSIDSLADALIRQMNLQIEDMKWHGEYQFLINLITNHTDLCNKVQHHQEALASARKRAGAILSASKPKPQSDPERISRAYKILEETHQASLEIQKKLVVLERQLKEIVGKCSDKEELQKAAMALVNRENNYYEELIEMYHSISGVHWDQPDLGYVLSEEIAKPIRFDACLDATNQLWEMINM